MNLEESHGKYALNDGKITHLEFDFLKKELNLKIHARKRILKQKYESCLLLLKFVDVKLFDLFEDFPTDGQYSDITLFKKPNEDIYASFDPYGNTGLAHEKDNWIIKSETLSVTEILSNN